MKISISAQMRIKIVLTDLIIGRDYIMIKQLNIKTNKKVDFVRITPQINEFIQNHQVNNEKK